MNGSLLTGKAITGSARSHFFVIRSANRVGLPTVTVGKSVCVCGGWKENPFPFYFLHFSN